uniref:Multidrug resistance-associated protein 1-like n=1 Tax=Phallusia mammillata TaxID=59560 RepID=A0A6F9D6B4_9ASCI|nr:multidrug resistance-associated protein 1-like [Phallusia mammillata]
MGASKKKGGKIGNFFSLLTFWWMNELFARGNKRDLKEEDLPHLKERDTSLAVCQRLEKNWNAEIKKAKDEARRPSLIKAVWKTYGANWLLYGIGAFFEQGVSIISPLFLARLLQYFENRASLTEAYWCAAGLTLVSFLFPLFHLWYFHLCEKIGWHIRIATCALMYKKTLVLSQKSLASTTTGQIVNLGATDVIRFDYLPLFLHYLWIGPVMIVVVEYLLWQNVGASSFVGIGFVIFGLLCQGMFGRLFGKIRGKMALQTDKRVRLINEIISAMRVVKMYAWETPYKTMVGKVRRNEIQKVLMASLLKAWNISMTYTAPKLITLATFVVYVYLGGQLSSSKVFAVIAWFNVLRIPVGIFTPFAVEKLAESRVSFRRIETFLLLGELDKCEEISSTNKEKSSHPKIVFDRLCATWDDVNLGFNHNEPDLHKNAAANGNGLKDINFTMDNSSLVAVIGPVGSGKSSLLSAILKELPPKSGKVEISGRVAYVSQTSWVFSGSLKENILFGEKYDAQRYNQIIDGCALRKDIESLENGDQTLVGERGVSLSGGQKARVNLARAAYRENTEIILLDDPLSAVDANVANHIFHQCICGFLKNRIRVLVTHQLQILQHVDQILVLKEGQISASGTFEELQEDGTDFAALLRRKEDEDNSIQHTVAKDMENGDISLGSEQIENDKNPENQVDFVAKIAQEETKSQGSIGWKSYIKYLTVNKFMFICLIFIILASNTLFVLTDWWMSVWATRSEEFFANQTIFQVNTTSEMRANPVFFNNQYYINILAYLTGGFAFFFSLQTTIQKYHLAMAGKAMHNKMLEAILLAPIRFFDINPTGRILNRFSKDMGQIDEVLPLVFTEVVILSGIVLTVVIVAVVVNYFAVIPLIPLSIYFVWLRRYYIKTSRDIKRMEGINRSPVFAHLSTTIQGLATIRAFRMHENFEQKFHHLQDLHSGAWYGFICGARWFALRVDLISTLFIGAVAFLSVITRSVSDLNAGQVGLTVIYATQLLGLLQWVVRQSAEIENQMTSVERIQQYCKIPSEPPHYISDPPTPSDWPSAGKIQMHNVTFAHYEGAQNVLHDVSATIYPNEKIGIVGRTGAGKSSLICCLFRLNELSSGKITVDGVDISKLGLTALRSSISAIPQDPVLFAGTLRNNLDPFSSYSDDNLWDVLAQVQMKETVETFPQKLEMELAESGSNFSVGQRQLLCLARAILRRNKILVIDEATASVDIRTDKLIQETIRNSFKDCTVITVAHRVNTIIDCDRVMYLQTGRLVEFDAPHKLLLDAKSSFTEMVNALGSAESKDLRQAAEQALRKRR